MNICFDVETYTKDETTGKLKPILNCNKFTLGCLRIKDKTEFFYTPQKMQERMIQIAQTNKKNKLATYFYAHNAEYDTLAIFKNKILNGELKIIRQNPIIAQTDTYTILDTMAFINESLKEIGKRLNTPKLEMPNEPNDIEEIKPYLERDVIITETLLKKIETIMNKLGTKSKSMWTTPQLAMAHYINQALANKNAYPILDIRYEKNQWGKQQPTVEILKTKHDTFLRKAYRLGRCEAFKTGKHKNVFYIDQNAQFPYALTIMDCPNLRQEYYLKKPLEIIQKTSFMNNYVGVCKATVNITTNHIGSLPIRYTQYEMIYPKKGKVTGYWTITELKYAEEQQDCEIIDIHEAVFYTKTRTNPFKEHIQKLYKHGQENPDNKIVTKLLMNGIIGKFGQKIEDEDLIFDYRSEYIKYKQKGYKIVAEIDNKFAYKKISEPTIPKYGNVMIALQCTATARTQMNLWLRKIDKKDLIYTDTDSIIANNWQKYEKHYKIGNELGEFKIVKDKDETPLINTECEIRKEKAYKIGKTVKLSGLSKRLITDDIFEKIDKNEIKQPKIIGLNEAIKRGDITKIGEFEEENFTITEKMKNEIELPDTYEET